MGNIFFTFFNDTHIAVKTNWNPWAYKILNGNCRVFWLAPQEMLATVTEAKRELAWGCGLMWMFLGCVVATTKTHPPVRTLPTAVSPYSLTTNKPPSDWVQYLFRAKPIETSVSFTMWMKQNKTAINETKHQSNYSKLPLSRSIVNRAGVATGSGDRNERRKIRNRTRTENKSELFCSRTELLF